MQYREWQELIPFYVAKTLSIQERRAFEAFLKRQPHHQQELDEWREIAGVVWQETDRAARNLPPLSDGVRSRLKYRRPAAPLPTHTPDYVRKQRRSTISLPITAAAAGFLLVFLFAATVIYTTLRSRDADVASQVEIALQSTQTVAAGAASDGASTTPDTETPAAQPSPTRDDFGIIETTPIPPSPAPTNTQVPPSPTPRQPVQLPPPTQQVIYITPTPMPFGGGGQVEAGSGGAGGTGGGIDPAGQTGMFDMIQGTPEMPLCMAVNENSSPVNIYRNPSNTTNVVEVISPQQSLRVNVTSGTGWYELFAPDTGEAPPQPIGWVNGSEVSLRGDCGILPVASPTPQDTPSFNLPTATPTIGINANATATPTIAVTEMLTFGTFQRASVPIHVVPGSVALLDYTTSMGERVQVTGTTTQAGLRYYRVQLNDGRSGYVREDSLTLESGNPPQ